MPIYSYSIPIYSYSIKYKTTAALSITTLYVVPLVNFPLFTVNFCERNSYTINLIL